MIKDVYEIILRLKTPSEKGKALNFYDELHNIIEASEIFNEKFRAWSKRMIITQVDFQSISLLLFIEKEKEHISSREIRFFTTTLINDYSWADYSREKSKLFAGTAFHKLTKRDTIAVLKSLENDALGSTQKLEIEKVLALYNNDRDVNRYNALSENVNNLTDTQALAIMQYLLETKNLGDTVQKETAIQEIKLILIHYI